ncbi:class I SAM-dependent methyltransferase [Vibrio marisflavi]|uniref:tRNA 5-carboxymethoxyuridine methyltransferase n=1 Tax=Vibrio marisflavi CECT 7928 TaxID=634439 RepID=A0ABM9A3S9_9VIBR|nr:class I SAM-dependent methyltransferase [Vibrio marisflavi]CAH0539218.1 tRNA 5-carboxymethoxyuridine methyltransferase [Vibrio marisflavi CECT 7928]
MFDKYGLEATHNSFGFMHTLSPMGKAFIEYSSQTLEKPLLDIGCAFGVTTLPCLENGAKVVACDIEQSHLDELKRRAPLQHHENLTLQLGRFPEEMDFAEGSFSGIFISHVLPFLSEQELKDGFQKISKWLAPGGKLFLLCYSPFHKTMSDFIPTYLERIKTTKTFAGLVDNKRDYESNEIVNDDLPDRLMLFDVPTVEHLFELAGLDTELCEHIGGVENGVPEIFCLDGREWVGAIGVKPQA